MTDDALKRAYRLMTARQSGGVTSDSQANAAAPISADTLAGLANADYAEAERDIYLAAVAESAQNADLLRALRSLANDATGLTADVHHLANRTRARPEPARRPVLRPARWYALAASVAMAGLVGVVMKAPVSSQDAPAGVVNVTAIVPVVENEPTATHGKIMMASFEGSSASVGDGSNKPTIFVGDFDS